MYRFKKEFTLLIMLINFIQFNVSYHQQQHQKQQKERQQQTNDDYETARNIRQELDEKQTSNSEYLKCDRDSQFCYKSDFFLDTSSLCLKKNHESNFVFLFFDINPQEGFNLRRDVFMRVAILADFLNKRKFQNKKWIIVLPPWDDLYHWKSKNIVQNQLRWSTFFDLESLNKFTPVIELDTLLQNRNEFIIDTIYSLELDQSDLKSNGFEQFRFLDRCETFKYKKSKDDRIDGAFPNYKKRVSSKQLKCVSFRGTNKMMANKIVEIISKDILQVGSIMLDRAEALLHDSYGDLVYWKCRRSMRFNKKLIDKANEIRIKYLNSSDQFDNTIEINPDWTQNKMTRSEKRGGPYVGVHLRRGDFSVSRGSRVVTLKNAAVQIVQTCMKLNLNRVYLATDAKKDELRKLREFIKEKNDKLEVIRYEPNENELEELKDGGWAIVEQLICAHARFFIGTMESTYSLRIQEEREILGFQAATTFNGLCNENPNGLCKTSEWLIVY